MVKIVRQQRRRQQQQQQRTQFFKLYICIKVIGLCNLSVVVLIIIFFTTLEPNKHDK